METGLLAKPISTANACGLSIGNKVIYEIIINNYNKYKKRYEKDKQSQLSIIYTEKSIQDNVTDKSE